MILLVSIDEELKFDSLKASDWCFYVNKLPINKHYKVHIKVKYNYLSTPITLKTSAYRNDIYAMSILKRINFAIDFYSEVNNTSLDGLTYSIDGNDKYFQ